MSMELADKTFLVVGLGKTGKSTVEFLVRRGARVVVSDARPERELGDELTAFTRGAPVEMHLGGHDPALVAGVDGIVPSPGVPPRNVLLREGLKRTIPVLSEIELASRFIRKPIIAVTGTNGKTTTTELLGRIFTHCGKEVFVGGNLGTPFITAVEADEAVDLHVVEVSSFQLQWVHTFHPTVAVLLNVSVDHVDYHGSFEEYRAVKERVFACQDQGDLAILNAEDPRTALLAREIEAEVALFSSARRVDNGMYVEGNDLISTGAEGVKEVCPVSEIGLKGTHNLENVMAAVMTARWCGCPAAPVKEAVRDFQGIPHRIEYVGGRDGIEYYNDSKGTNVGAVLRALEAFDGQIVLLMGGRHKGGRFSDLRKAMQGKVKRLILFGEAREAIATEIADAVKTLRVERMSDAVTKASEEAANGDVVLLSPGCASFDEFKDYKERGEVFRQAVHAITGSEDRG